ncbi:MAG: DUF2294 domain-containing protein [Solirubrobacterales bacterium]|nr:DUF2294 domain-containing protein [Solirubrobacterales bacterium]MBV9714412.1 DUF2294 domain-containing protein [Solirubrobacterales bacterium]
MQFSHLDTVSNGLFRADGRSPMLELSNAMVRLYKDVFGRGPTKARAHFAGPDTLVIVLEDSMTVAERNLASLGEHQRLRDARMFFQYAVEREFRQTVEQILGRRTVAFISGIDTREDVAVELFTLEPEGAVEPRAAADRVP